MTRGCSGVHWANRLIGSALWSRASTERRARRIPGQSRVTGDCISASLRKAVEPTTHDARVSGRLEPRDSRLLQRLADRRTRQACGWHLSRVACVLSFSPSCWRPSVRRPIVPVLFSRRCWCREIVNRLKDRYLPFDSRRADLGFTQGLTRSLR